MENNRALEKIFEKKNYKKYNKEEIAKLDSLYTKLYQKLCWNKKWNKGINHDISDDVITDFCHWTIHKGKKYYVKTKKFPKKIKRKTIDNAGNFHSGLLNLLLE